MRTRTQGSTAVGRPHKIPLIITVMRAQGLRYIGKSFTRAKRYSEISARVCFRPAADEVIGGYKRCGEATGKTAKAAVKSALRELAATI